MVSKEMISALAAIGSITFSSSASIVAQEPWNEVRQALYGSCERFTGHANGICMRAAAQKMNSMSEESRLLYRECLAEGNSRSVCDQGREQYWLNKLVF